MHGGVNGGGETREVSSASGACVQSLYTAGKWHLLCHAALTTSTHAGMHDQLSDAICCQQVC
jgi:hypothetical protein